MGDGLAETHSLSLSREGCFEDQHFLQLQALSHRCDVIDHRGRKLFVPKPHTDKCVTTGEYQQGVEVCLLQARSEQQRKIKACGQAAIEYL